MSLKRIRLALLVVASCGGQQHEERVTVQPPQTSPQPPPVALHDAGAPAQTACLAAFDGGSAVDKAKLDEIAKSAATEAEKRYQRGRLYYQAEHWVEAASEFRAVAFDEPDSSVGIFASQLYLDCLNILASHQHRASCFDEMAREVPGLHDLYCGVRRSKNAEMCETLDKIQLDLERLRAQRTMEDGVAKGDAALVHTSGEQFLAMVRAHCMPPTSTTLRCDELAYNAAAAFIAAGDEPAAKRVQAILVDPKNKMDKSPLVTKLACRLDPTPRPECR